MVTPVFFARAPGKPVVRVFLTIALPFCPGAALRSEPIKAGEKINSDSPVSCRRDLTFNRSYPWIKKNQQFQKRRL